MGRRKRREESAKLQREKNGQRAPAGYEHQPHGEGGGGGRSTPDESALLSDSESEEEATAASGHTLAPATEATAASPNKRIIFRRTRVP